MGPLRLEGPLQTSSNDLFTKAYRKRPVPQGVLTARSERCCGTSRRAEARRGRRCLRTRRKRLVWNVATVLWWSWRKRTVALRPVELSKRKHYHFFFGPRSNALKANSPKLPPRCGVRSDLQAPWRTLRWIPRNGPSETWRSSSTEAPAGGAEG